MQINQIYVNSANMDGFNFNMYFRLNFRRNIVKKYIEVKRAMPLKITLFATLA